jgi:chromosome segregation ATPase
MGEGFQKTRELEGENKTLKKEIERLNIDLAKALQLGHTISEYENRFQILAEEIDRLNNVLREKSRELTEEYARSRQLGEMSQQKDEELVEFQEKIRELEGSNSKLQREHRETLASLSNLEQTKSLTQSYEASLEKLSIEVDRLNNVLRKKLNELDEARRKNNEYEIKLKTLEAIERENSDYKIRYAEVNKKISDYERKIAEGREENERLNYSIKKLIGELNSSELKFKGFEKEIENLHKTIEILSSEIQSERDGRQNLSSQLNGLRV